MSDELKAQAKEMAGFYGLRFLYRPTPQFMCHFAKDRYPQLHGMLYGIFKERALSAVVMDNMPPGSYDLHRHPNLIRYPNIVRCQYLRYIGRYGKAPPWKLVYQWMLKVTELRIYNDWGIDVSGELSMIKEQARELAGIYKLRYLRKPVPEFMCSNAKDRYPQLYDMLNGIFEDRDLVSVVMNNVPSVSYIPSCHPNLVRYQYLRYIGGYGEAPPWELVYQWILMANELRIDNDWRSI